MSADAKRVNIDGLLALEQPLVRVPLEQLKRTVRSSQKYIEKGVLEVNAQLQDTAKKAANGLLAPADAAKALETMHTRLQNLKRKLDESKAEEAFYTARTRARLDHLGSLAAISSTDSDDFARWSRVRLDRVLVDYMLRCGHSNSAYKLAGESDIEKLVDIDLFEQSRRVEEALRKQSCTECLQWCAENRSALRKIKSSLEFNLRLQEFIELVRTHRLKDAIAYSRKHLTPWSDTQLYEIQTAMALLAFRADTQCYKYQQLFHSRRWDELVLQFRKDNFALNALTTQPLLKMSLQAGLAALKTPMCNQPSNRNLNCPVCDPGTFGDLATGLPNALHRNSCIVCRVSGAFMNEENPPYVLPNGNVYSRKALEHLASESSSGQSIVDPRTGAVFPYSSIRRVHIMT